MEDRSYMPFFKNYLDAADELPYPDACRLVYAIVYTGLNGTEPEQPLKGGAAAAFRMVKDGLLLSFERSKSGSKGGSKTQANAQANAEQTVKQTSSKTEANGQANAEQQAKLKKKEKDKYYSSQKETIYSSNYTSKAKKDFASQYVRHGEVSPLMKEAAERMLNEEESA